MKILMSTINVQVYAIIKEKATNILKYLIINMSTFINDALYIYDHIPFINGIGDIYNNSESYISKEELDDYIKDNNIIMKNDHQFKLCDQRTWNINI